MVEADKTTAPTIKLAEDSKLRAINCDINPFSRGDGAAIFAIGSTCVVATMLGPVEVKQQFLKIDKAHVECIYRPKAGLPQIRDKILESVIQEACETAIVLSMHPRTMFSVHIQELDDCGGLDACAINAACMALICGGVPMKFTFAAVHCILNEKNELILDPDTGSESNKRIDMTFVFDSLDKQLVGLQIHGHISMAQMQAAEQVCREASEKIFQHYRKSLANYHKKILFKTKDQTQEVQEPMET